MTKARALVLIGVLLSMVVMLGCKKPKEGDPCQPNQAVCLADKSSALGCGPTNKLFPMTCRGPKGCFTQGKTVLCDDSVATAGDGCDEENETACAVDRKAALECHGNKFVVGETCKGPRGCTIAGENITCDNDISDVDDPCHFEGDYACTNDKSYALKCVSHKMTKLNSCRGAKACRVFELPQEKKVEFVCDDSLAQPDDSCDEEGERACSMDKKSIYVCKNLKFTMLNPCDGPKGCTFDDKGEKFDCDSVTAGGKPVNVKQPAAPGMPIKPSATTPKKK